MSKLLKKLSSKNTQVYTAPQSFFDDVLSDSNASFWFKDQSVLNDIKINNPNGFFFYKKSKKRAGELKPIFLSIHKNFLLFSKTREGLQKPHKFVDISRYFLTFQKVSLSSNKYSAGIYLSYNQKQIELFSRTLDDLNTFLYHFRWKVIQTDFDEKYSVDKKLGKGSYAEVFCVKDKVTRRTFAAKFFDMTSVKDVSRTRIALKNEINIHRQLEHGNICRIHEIFEDSSNLIIVMELAKGKRLIDYVIEHAPLSEKESVIITRELLETLSYLHSLQIIHRDIKLENIMIHKETPDSERMALRLIDFGLAATVDNIELFKRSGTPGYVAPEVLTADKYDTKVDIFSLGVILFTMLTGRSPFLGPDRTTVLRLNKRCEYSFKPKYWDDKSQNARDIVKRMMEAKPHKRISIQEALAHGWFNRSGLDGPQSLKALSKEFLSPDSPRKDSLSHRKDSSRPTSVERSVEKSKTIADSSLTVNKLPPSSARKSKYQASRSSSARSGDTPLLGFGFSNNNPNLLQIPPSHAMLASFDAEEDKSDIGMPINGINRESLRTFYKLNSDVYSEDPGSPDSKNRGDQSPLFTYQHTNYEVPTENAKVKDRVTSLKETNKALKSPFRRSIQETSLSEIVNKKTENDTSCDVFYTNMEETILAIPQQTTFFKASMGYINMKSKEIIK